MWCNTLLILSCQCCAMVCEYRYFEEEKTWTEAQQYCREKHTDLVTVTNMTDIKRLLSNSAGNKREAWIGLYDQTNTQRTWHWSLPGVEYNKSETNWEKTTNEPNNLGADQNCGIIWNSVPLFLKWGDISCNERYHFLCYDDNNSSQTFHLIKQEKTWLEAQSYCREKHTDLISGLNQLKEENMRNGFDFQGPSRYIFIGLFSDTWKWSDGSGFSFRHWNLKFDNQRINSSQCAMTVFDDGGRWKNEDCSVRKPFICYDAHKRILIKENKTWQDALSYCRKNHHDLVTIAHLDEQRSVQEKAQFASTPFVWIGVRYFCAQNSWSFVCPGVVSYEYETSDGQIDDSDLAAAMEKGREYRWFQKKGSEELNFICVNF